MSNEFSIYKRYAQLVGNRICLDLMKCLNYKG